MKKMASILTSVMALASASNASALVIFPGVGDLDPGAPTATFAVSGDISSGPVSAEIGRSGLPSGIDTDEFRFIIDQFGVGGGSITSQIAGGTLGDSTDLDFLAVDFSNDGGTTWISIPQVPNGAIEFAGLTNIPIISGNLNILRVQYEARGDGAYGGSLTFRPAVPEPATWALMMLGFGAIGFAMRRRKQEVRVRYAM